MQRQIYNLGVEWDRRMPVIAERLKMGGIALSLLGSLAVLAAKQEVQTSDVDYSNEAIDSQQVEILAPTE